MKTILTTIFLFSTVFLFAQENAMHELKDALYNLPLESGIETIIDSAEQTNELTEINYQFERLEPYYQATLSVNEFFQIEPISGNIEIFISDYGLAGQDVDSLQVIYVSLKFGSELNTEIKTEYKRLVKRFKKVTANTEKYELFADSGKIGYGQYFYENGDDDLPFMAIEVGLGDCTSDGKSITIFYYKKLSTTKPIRNAG